MAVPPVRVPLPKLLVVGSAGLCALLARVRPDAVVVADAVALAEAFAVGGFTHAVVGLDLGWVDGAACLASLRRRFPEAALYALGDVAQAGVLRAALDARVADVVAPTWEGLAAVCARLPVPAVEAPSAVRGASDAERSRFAAEVAHDLREPLRSSRLLLERVEACLSRGDADGAVALVARLYDAAARLEEQVDGALAAGTGRPADGEGSSHADRVLDEVLEQLQALVEQTGGTVERGPLPEVGLPAHQLRQLLQNLVANALRYGGDPPRIEVTAARDGEVWELRVRDHGPGIPLAERDAIFRPLTRLGGPTAPGGHGLGLAICRKLVMRAGGTIAVEDAPGGGSCFVVRLPPVAQDEPTERLAR